MLLSVSARIFPKCVPKQKFHREKTSKILSWVLSTSKHICVNINDVFHLTVMLIYLRMTQL